MVFTSAYCGDRLSYFLKGTKMRNLAELNCQNSFCVDFHTWCSWVIEQLRNFNNACCSWALAELHSFICTFWTYFVMFLSFLSTQQYKITCKNRPFLAGVPGNGIFLAAWFENDHKGTNVWVSAFTAYCFSSAFAFNEAFLAHSQEWAAVSVCSAYYPQSLAGTSKAPGELQAF